MALAYKFWFPGPLPYTLHQNFQEKKKNDKFTFMQQRQKWRMCAR